MHLFGVSISLLNPRSSSASILSATHSRHQLPIPPSSGAMNTIQEEGPSRPTSSVTINIGFFPPVPSIIDYGAPSCAISSSQYSQIEYENVRIADLEHNRRLAIL